MRVNGTEIKLDGECTLMEFLVSKGYPIGQIAVEMNGGIVSRTAYETVTLSDGDSLEVVTFMGGG